MGCDKPGWCEELGKNLVNRAWEMYSGECLEPDHPRPCKQKLRDKYIALWKANKKSGKWSTMMGCGGCGKKTNSINKMKNFGKALLNFAKSGGKMVSEEERTARLAVCKDCPLYRDKGDLSTCRACGCYLYAKTWMATEECPKGYWAGEANEGSKYGV